MDQCMIRLSPALLDQPSNVDGRYGVLAGEGGFKGSIHMIIGPIATRIPTMGAITAMSTQSHGGVSKSLYQRGAL
jgi:hypothetical protein